MLFQKLLLIGVHIYKVYFLEEKEKMAYLKS